ncbi:zf-HC2 domain-containing protein [Tissierella pigra]|uniref:Zf-HC2 domain-containing protein n=1 Tax=Tissierella pigra TaxID=2607614 RepID=A0A6N7XEK6_9FIRM|nr:zf-HC2 domain-containing protein [Tissierella pigra]MBU5427669.1 zf-HC2 domain-containing protein [Tissierella pigra]MSU00419.1 zf-HC2 domain-containing protein [Tissierella pigra]
MSKITCNICMDLIPLVKDGVACTDSEKAVFEHLKECADCNSFFKDLDQKPIINDKKAFGKIKKQVNLSILIITVLSILFGIGLSMSENMFYNIVIMPVIGVVSFIILKNRAYVVTVFVFVVSYIWHFVMFYSEISYGGFLSNLIASLYWALIYSGLCALGTLIVFLLYFAFKKED